MRNSQIYNCDRQNTQGTGSVDYCRLIPLVGRTERMSVFVMMGMYACPRSTIGRSESDPKACYKQCSKVQLFGPI